jgi:Holliday junction resolvase RusA-like endonuclease
MSTPVHITILGPCATKKNSGRIARTKNGIPFLLPSKPYVKWLAVAAPQARVQWFTIVGGSLASPCGIAATFYRARRVGDLDNFLAALGDCLQKAGVIKNDRQIMSWDGSRLEADPKNPRVELLITPLNEVPPITLRAKRRG